MSVTESVAEGIVVIVAIGGRVGDGVASSVTSGGGVKITPDRFPDCEPDD